MFLFLLTGCGFHLRGHDAVLNTIHSLYVETNDPYGPLTKMIYAVLKSQGVGLVETPTEATYILEIIGSDKAIQTTGFGLSNQVSVNTLTYSLKYRLIKRSGVLLIPQRTINSVRSFTINTNQALMGNVIPESLLETMRRDLSHQLADQLNTWKLHEITARPTC